MKKQQIIYIVLSLLVGIGIGYFAFAQLDSSDEDTMKTSSSMQESSMAKKSMHKEVEVDPALPIPTVSVSATRDSMDGYNLKIDVTNFSFTPENVGKENEPNTGHAHIYINDEKLGRVYGDWFYLPSKYLEEGENKIMISLNGNDHSDWMVNGQHIESVVVITK